MKISSQNILKIFFIFTLIFGEISAQECLPDSRSINWKYAGLQNEEIISPDNWIFIDQLEGSDTEKLTSAIDSANILQGNTIIYFQSESYRITSTITIDETPQQGSITFLGNINNDSTTTILFENLDADDDCFIVKGHWSGNKITVTEDFHKNSNVMTLEETSDLHDGDWIRFSEPGFEDDYSNNSEYIGQVSQIEDITGNTITLKDKASKNYLASNDMWIRKIDPTANIGFENLKIERDNSEKGYGKSFYFYLTNNCWLKGIESYNCTGYHVNVNQSTHIEISGCYIHKATNYDSNEGTGYGVVLGSATTNCLVENNIFIKTRHAMLVGTGANANVFAYNYSNDAAWDYPDDAGDIRLHGRFPYGNLFEGNSVDYIFGDPTHGDNGPYNTFFRNHVRNNNLKLFNADSSNVGKNYLPNGDVDFDPNWLEALVWPDVKKSKHYLKFNDCELSSLYYENTPVFFTESDLFPSIETGNLIDKIPSRKRYLAEDEYLYYNINNYPPIKLDTIPDIVLEEDSENRQIDLKNLIMDINITEDEIIKEISSISDDELLKGSISGNTLEIQLQENAFGTAHIEVQFNSEDDLIWDTFNIDILPVNDIPTGKDTTIYHYTYKPFTFDKNCFPYQDIEDDTLPKVDIIYFGTNGTLSYKNLKQNSSFEVTDFEELELADFDEFAIQYYVVDSNNERSNSSYQIVIVKNDTIHGFTAPMPDTSIFENSVYQWQYTTDSISKYSIHSLKQNQNGSMTNYQYNDSKIQLDSITGKFTWNTDFTDAGKYQLVVAKSKYYFLDMDTTDIIIKNVNRLPVFTEVLPDTSIDNLNTLQFQYLAEDPDNDVLKFGISNEMDSLTINTNGLLAWHVPKAPQPEYQINIFVTDDMDTAFTSAIVKVENLVAIDKTDNIPTHFILHQNFPNPFNSSTSICYELPEDTFVNITVYDIRGKLVMKPTNEYSNAGKYKIFLNCDEMPTGLYFYKIDAGKYHALKKMILLK